MLKYFKSIFRLSLLFSLLASFLIYCQWIWLVKFSGLLDFTLLSLLIVMSCFCSFLRWEQNIGHFFLQYHQGLSRTGKALTTELLPRPLPSAEF